MSMTEAVLEQLRAAVGKEYVSNAVEKHGVLL